MYTFIYDNDEKRVVVTSKEVSHVSDVMDLFTDFLKGVGYSPAGAWSFSQKEMIYSDEEIE